VRDYVRLVLRNGKKSYYYPVYAGDAEGIMVLLNLGIDKLMETSLTSRGITIPLMNLEESLPKHAFARVDLINKISGCAFPWADN
jgi:hypothetical protein